MTRWMLRTLRGMDTPIQWAGGLALGVLTGLLPLNSLLPVFCAGLLILSGANLLTGTFGCLTGFALKPLFAVSFESLGQSLLTWKSLQPFWVLLSEMPLGPWCRFENTLVTGSLAGGILIAFPLFLTGWIGARHLRRWLSRLFVQSDWTAWLVEDGNEVSRAGVANP